jgi:hypothetical protein
MLELIRVEPLTGLHTNGRFLALPTNIRHGWKYLIVINALAYDGTLTIIVVKSFIAQTPGPNVIKL